MADSGHQTEIGHRTVGRRQWTLDTEIEVSQHNLSTKQLEASVGHRTVGGGQLKRRWFQTADSEYRTLMLCKVFLLSDFQLSDCLLSNFLLSDFLLTDFSLSAFQLSDFLLSDFPLSDFLLSDSLSAVRCPAG